MNWVLLSQKTDFQVVAKRFGKGFGVRAAERVLDVGIHLHAQ